MSLCSVLEWKHFDGGRGTARDFFSVLAYELRNLAGLRACLGDRVMFKNRHLATVEHREEIAIVKVHRDLVTEKQDIFQLMRTILSAVEDGESRYVVLDMEDVSGVSTGALASLVKVRRQVHEDDVGMKVCHLSSEKIVDSVNDTFSHEIFKIIELEKFLAISSKTAHIEAGRLALLCINHDKCKSDAAVTC